MREVSVRALSNVKTKAYREIHPEHSSFYEYPGTH